MGGVLGKDSSKNYHKGFVRLKRLLDGFYLAPILSWNL